MLKTKLLVIILTTHILSITSAFASEENLSNIPCQDVTNGYGDNYIQAVNNLNSEIRDLEIMYALELDFETRKQLQLEKVHKKIARKSLYARYRSCVNRLSSYSL